LKIPNKAGNYKSDSKKSSKTVSVAKNLAGNKRVTLVLTFALDSSKLPLLIIFKGKFDKKLQENLGKIELF